MSDSVKKQQIESPYTRYKDMADDAVSLQILELIDQGQETSQRKITRETGLATGLVHSYMSRVINKGWIKAKQVSAKRWFYYLTPEGFLEKSRLTIKYLSVTLDSYRSAQTVITDTLDDCVRNGWGRLVVAGTDHLAEILILNIRVSAELELAGVVVRETENATNLGVEPVLFGGIHSLSYDRIIACDVTFIDWCKKSNDVKALTSRLIYLGADGILNGKKR